VNNRIFRAILFEKVADQLGARGKEKRGKVVLIAPLPFTPSPFTRLNLSHPPNKLV
jgi:hypothetical protein